jgi:hypothetical protein
MHFKTQVSQLRQPAGLCSRVAPDGDLTHWVNTLILSIVIFEGHRQAMSGILYIAEIDTLGTDARGNTIMAGVRPTMVKPYNIPINGVTVEQSQVFSNQTRFLELHCTVECWFDIAVTPSPINTAEHLGAGERIFYPLRDGMHGMSIAVIGA